MVAVVVTGRGGAGKTTMSANLSTYFSLNGYKTLVIDGDLYLPKLAFHFGIYNPVTNLHTLLSTPDARLKDAIYHDVKTGVDVLPGSSKLFDILTMDEKRLRDIVRDAAENYDVTFIDSPVGIPFDTISTFRLAQYQLIIVELGRCPVHSFRKMVENEVDKLKALGEAYGLKVGVILNKVREEKPIVDDIVEYLEESVGVPVVGIVSFDPAVPASQNRGIPVVVNVPHSHAARDIRMAGDVLREWIFGVEMKRSLLDSFLDTLRSLFLRLFPSGKKL
ncbi:ATPase involved in chromosome partitioning, ParA/MinD family [Thermococcus kodakarensis KOD1]|uniref:ATPase involved in chromosome partitioning, ParA/MinD family n=1 Tax=Thermococcus kodakarensis (strain ATCC BAA-918 / JCM 12380 / KOD1) TaxID=69014 RepID=Q5JHF5_THEKO|nr:MinD/ParA family protein [Thermococcus kodakarensis]WCN27983.1 MinD/ParA family protein [Thermococcus kodakarensis]WCN30282.1 MinD/ParA family protein [Thermococcus kodakarensis]BAD86326.1 ATPase involved in chromosome partitioning, ParA/MinD family [Thermococcus kodakarensis KOD1]